MFVPERMNWVFALLCTTLVTLELMLPLMVVVPPPVPELVIVPVFVMAEVTE